MVSNIVKSPKLLAIASAGGHWEQLCRLSEAFDECQTIYVTTNPHLCDQVPKRARFETIIDANAWTKMRLLVMSFQVLLLLLRVRPEVIVTTGAAPGYFAVFLGKYFGARSLWVDSIANAEELSRSGRLAKRYATCVVSQWEDVAASEGVLYRGALL